MISLDMPTFFALVLAAVLLGALFPLAAAWRGLQAEAGALPVWGFAKRRGSAVPAQDALLAEMRCGMCASQAQCRQLLASGGAKPPEGCFNLKLLS